MPSFGLELRYIPLMEMSVVVTNFNYGRFLARCLRSLLNQSLDRKFFEIIVVDDASTDDSKAILEVFESKVTLIRNEINLGLAASSNVGIQTSTGRYVVRVDSDDYVHPDFVKTLMLGFELFGENYQAISVDYLQITPQGKFLEYGNSEISPIACGIGFKMDAIEQIGFYNPKLRINEEVDLRKRFQDEGFQIRNINLPMYKYVKHDQSLTNHPLI